FHSCTKSLLLCLLNKIIEKPQIIHLCIKKIYLLLIQHTNKQYVEILWNCLMNVYRTINSNNINNYFIYEIFYEIFQLLIDYKMIIDINLCYEFLTIIKINKNNEFIKIHYETVFKLMKQIGINKQIIEIYYQFVEQTSSLVLYQETRKIFQCNLHEKLSNEFYIYLWNQLLKK
ncbi:unnamed protein product, partial [Rotaria sp. Silwood1]